jgi:hypothetical protein
MGRGNISCPDTATISVMRASVKARPIGHYIGRKSSEHAWVGAQTCWNRFLRGPRVHYDTYIRLFCEHHEADMEQLTGMRQWLDKLQRQVG